jgi:hypothetical protein
VVGQPPPGLSGRNEGRVQRDRRVAISVSRLLAERYLTELVEPCRALPRKCLFIYLFDEDSTGAGPHPGVLVR